LRIAMSMTTYVIGIRAADEDWKKKRAAVQALVDAGISVPVELTKYFGGRDGKYILKDDTSGLEIEIPREKGHSDSGEWLEIRVKDIPQGVERVRFINSW
jgi:hypothetical protein